MVRDARTFALPSFIDRPLEDVVATYRDPERVLTQVVLKAKIRDQALGDLDKMNISFATLFPGLDGLARSMGRQLETHWDFDPKMAERKGLDPSSYRDPDTSRDPDG